MVGDSSAVLVSGVRLLVGVAVDALVGFFRVLDGVMFFFLLVCLFLLLFYLYLSALFSLINLS